LQQIDDVIARGWLDDWKQLRDAAASGTDIRERILRYRNLTCPIHTRSDITSGTFMSESNLPEWEQLESKEICATINRL
jgi:hypothetical protein